MRQLNRQWVTQDKNVSLLALFLTLAPLVDVLCNSTELVSDVVNITEAVHSIVQMI